MTTYATFKHFEEMAERLGLRIGQSKFGYEPGRESVALYPTPEKWPCYNPDFEMYAGSIEGMITFMVGLEKGLQYATYLGWSREKSEAKYRAAVEKRKHAHERQSTFNVLKGETPVPFEPDRIG